MNSRRDVFDLACTVRLGEKNITTREIAESERRWQGDRKETLNKGEARARSTLRSKRSRVPADANSHQAGPKRSGDLEVSDARAGGSAGEETD